MEVQGIVQNMQGIHGGITLEDLNSFARY